MRFPELEPKLMELEGLADEMRGNFRKMVGLERPIYTHDHLIWQIGVRTRAVTKAFCNLIREDNEYVASMLIRINLEHILLLEAGERHSDGVDGFTLELLQGKELREIKDKTGRRMSGGYLAEQFEQNGQYYNVDGVIVRIPSSKESGANTLKGVWSFYSGHVHFDPKWLVTNIDEIVQEQGGTTVRHIFPIDTFTITGANQEDIENWIYIMHLVARNVNVVLGGCIDHATTYKWEQSEE